MLCSIARMFLPQRFYFYRMAWTRASSSHCLRMKLSKKQLGLAGKRIAIYAGNHGYAAGAEQILNAAKLLESHPDLHFLFVGDGPDKPRLQRMAADLQLQNTTVRGFCPARTYVFLPFDRRHRPHYASKSGSHARRAACEDFRHDGGSETHHSRSRGRSRGAHRVFAGRRDCSSRRTRTVCLGDPRDA